MNDEDERALEKGTGSHPITVLFELHAFLFMFSRCTGRDVPVNPLVLIESLVTRRNYTGTIGIWSQLIREIYFR